MDTSFNYFEALFNNAKENIVLLMEANGTITAINPAFTTAFGYTKSDIIGKHLSVLFTDEDQKKGLPEKELNTVINQGQSSDDNYLVHKNKIATWVSGESLLAKSSEGGITIVKIIQNIHVQKISEHALRHLKDFNESILSSIEDVVIVLDNKMKVIKVNNSFAKLFNNGDAKISSLNFAELIKPYDTNDDLFTGIQDVINAKSSFLNKEIEIDTASADKRIFDVTCTPIQNGDDSNVLLVLHDITVHKQIEREREDIIGFVAHELRNPLANVILCNEIMGESIKDNNIEELTDMLRRSKNNVMRLNKMIGELYDVTRISSGNLQLEISEFNFEEMIKEAIDTVKVLQPAYNIIVKGNGNILVRGDRYRLIQVVTNYLSNGIKYSNGNTDVTLTIGRDSNFITVSVKDEGLGIPKQQLPHIFERFFRAEKTRNIEGIGLGLYLCRRIINSHKGKVWAESVEGKGSVFYFSIPLNP